MRELRGRIAAVLAACTLAGCSGGDGIHADPLRAAPVSAPGAPDPQARAPERVEIARVGLARLETNLAASGSIRARRETALGAEVAGRLVEVLVDVGDTVEADQALFRVDPAPLELTLIEAQATLSLARAESENAAQEAERVRQLLAQHAASKRHHDQLRTAAAVARARVAQMEARVARARRDLECSVVRAPYAGSLVERRAHEGAMVGTEPVVVLQETGTLEAVLAIPEAWPAPVRVADRVRLRAPGLPGLLETRVSRVNERVDPASRTYEVRAPVPGSAAELKAGSYVEADVRVGTGGAVPVVDRSALILQDGHTFVFRVAEERAQRVEVRLGLETGPRVEVRGGLTAGDEVVVGETTTRLEDGTPLAPIRRVSAATKDTP